MLSDLLRWARITKKGDDDGKFALQQLEYLGKTANCLIVFPYGTHGNVPADSRALMMSIQGHADNRAAIAWTPKTRPVLKGGEVTFYHPPTGGTVTWKENGDLDITTGADVNVDCANATVNASASMDITTPTLTITGDIVLNGNYTQTGNLTVTGAMTNNGKDVGDTHGHVQGNDSDGDAEAAISGVT